MRVPCSLRLLLAAVVCVGAFAAAPDALAAPITIHVTGFVSTIIEDPAPIFSVSRGDPFELVATIDDATPDSSTSTTSGRFTDPAGRYDLTMGSYSLGGDQTQLWVTGTGIFLGAGGPGPDPDPGSELDGLDFNEMSFLWLGNHGDPNVFPDLAGISAPPFFDILFCETVVRSATSKSCQGGLAQVSLDVRSVSIVPEPATGLLVGLALIVALTPAVSRR